MTTAVAERPKPTTMAKANPSAEFRRNAGVIARALLSEWVGDDRAHEATGRISAALAASAASARDPSDFYACTPQSIGTCIAISALTGIMPGVGPTALAYVLPQRPRANEAPQLQYSLSHRGLNALARRCGQTMVAIPVGKSDTIQSSADGEVEVLARDIDNPPTRFDDLRGVVVIVKEISNGVVLCRGWVPRKLIEQRRAMSRSFTGRNPQYSPWSTWPIEMAMKTAMHYAISRGWCVIDDTSATRALNADVETEVRLLPAPPDTPMIEGRSASDVLADALEGAGEESQEVPESEPAVQTTDELTVVDEAPVQEVRDEFWPLENENDREHTARLGKLLTEATSPDRLTTVWIGCQREHGEGRINDDQFNSLFRKNHNREKGLKKGELIG